MKKFLGRVREKEYRSQKGLQGQEGIVDAKKKKDLRTSKTSRTIKGRAPERQ